MQRRQGIVKEFSPQTEVWLERRTTQSALTSAPVEQKKVQLGSVEQPLLALSRHWLKPAVAAVALFACEAFSSQRGAPQYYALALITLLVARQLFRPLELREKPSPKLFGMALLWSLPEWGAVMGVLALAGVALRLDAVFSRAVLLSWAALTPVLLAAAATGGAIALGRAAPKSRRYIIIGANELGEELARRVSQSLAASSFMGFFDFRGLDRLPERVRKHCAGRCHDVADFVKYHAIDVIYIALPMSNVPRIEELLRGFRDTTASIYFVPDILAFDLVQARCVEMNGMPMLSICDTPFYGIRAIQKRAVDLVLSTAAMLVLWPLMLAIAIAVKASSPGPVLFRQRRYGLNGEEILIYKFRSMTVWEDGPVVKQAIRQDQRVTAIGRLLRRTSLDELPQLFNVFTGTMSFVGPRPHAVAHNELYRKLINGYMIRHKVKPGMSGWAQVHGLRGETATVEQMRLRVQYDLDYLRHWSLGLDLVILMKTAMIVLQGRNAH